MLRTWTLSDVVLNQFAKFCGKAKWFEANLEFRPESQNDSLGVEFANLIESNKVIPNALGNFGFPEEHKPNFEDSKVSTSCVSRSRMRQNDGTLESSKCFAF